MVTNFLVQGTCKITESKTYEESFEIRIHVFEGPEVGKYVGYNDQGAFPQRSIPLLGGLNVMCAQLAYLPK